MANDFGCKHSDKLQRFFEIEARGVDFINHFGLRVEFKESWAKDKTQMFFSVPYEQLDNSDFIVFCVYDKEFYIHNSAHLLGKYFYNRGRSDWRGRCCLRYNTIRRNYLRKYESYEVLKAYLEGHKLG